MRDSIIRHYGIPNPEKEKGKGHYVTFSQKGEYVEGKGWQDTPGAFNTAMYSFNGPEAQITERDGITYYQVDGCPERDNIDAAAADVISLALAHEETKEDRRSPARRMIDLLCLTSQHTAWRHINPSRHSALILAITANLHFNLQDIAEIHHERAGGYWFPQTESLYSAACTSQNRSAILSVEAYLDRKPFLLNGDRLYVGKQFMWQDLWHTCTSMAEDSINARCQREDKKPIVKIHRTELEAHEQQEREKEHLAKLARREAMKPGAVELKPLDQHISQECSQAYCWSLAIPWASQYGTDYARAWKECTNGIWMQAYLRQIGLIPGYSRKAPDPASIRKRYPWIKVQDQIFRYLRQLRELPLKDPKETPA